jgi:hypothetical protein
MADTNADFLRQRFGSGGPQPGSPLPAGGNQQFLNQMFAPGQAYVPPGPREAQDIIDAVLAGFQSSATGLAWRGENPNLTVRADASWYERAASNASGMLLDLPLSIVGGAAGFAAGTAAAPGIGSAVGAGAGAFAAPMALREALMTAYSQNNARDWGDVWEIVKSGLKGGAKGAVIGGATGGAGRLALGALPAGAGGMQKFLASTAAEYPTLMAASAAVEGHMPTSQEFIDNAILLGGLKGAMAVAPKLRAIFVQTGKRPGEVVLDARRDADLHAFLTAEQPVVALRIGDQIFSAQPGEVTHGQIINRLVKERPEVIAPENGPTREIESGWRLGKEFLTREQALTRIGYDDTQSPAGLEAERRRAMGEIPPQYREMALAERIKAATEGDPRNEIVSGVIRELVRGDEALNVEQLFKQLPDAVKAEYLTDTDTARGVIRVIENVWRSEVEAQTRGVVPVPATMNAAMQRITAGLDPHLIGEAENASTLAARAVVLGATTEHVRRVAAELADKPEAEWTTTDKLRMAAAVESVQASYVDMRGASAEVGRALNILRQIKYNKSLMGDADAIIKLFGNNFRGLEWNELAKMAAALKDTSQLARFATDMAKATTTEKVIEAWKAAILSGPWTHMANMMGNIAKFTVEIPETALTVSMTQMRRALKGDAMSLAEFKAKAFAPIHGLMWGWRDAGVIALEALKGEGAHLEKADVYRHAIEGEKGKIIRLPFRALQAEDVLFRTVAERGRAYELAVERALAEKFKPGTHEFQERVAQYTMRPEFGLEAAEAGRIKEDIQNAGAEAVFAQRLGPRMEQAQAAMQGHALQFVIPFVRTPANLLSWAVQHTPGLNLLSGRWLNDFKAGGAARDRAIARVMIGGAMMMTAWSFIEAGDITGGGMFDPETRKTKMAAGWQPYSIRINGKYYSYQRLEPVAKVLGFAADWYEMQQHLEDEDKAKGGMAVLAMFGNATISTTYLQGLAGVFNALTDPTRYGERFFEQYAASTVPKFIGQTAALIDPNKREVDSITDSIQSQIPFLREKLMPKRDVWGEPAKNQRLFGVLPITASEESKNKVKTEAVRLGLALTDVPKVLYEAGPLKPKDRKVELTPEQLDVARAVTGKAAMDILAPIVESKDWDKIPDFAKEKLIKGVLAATRTPGRLAALPPTAPERIEARQKIVDEIVRQVQAVGG